MKRRAIFFTIFMIFASFFTSFANEEDMQTEKAKVLSVQEEQVEGEFGVNSIQHVKLEILTGQYKGDIVESDNLLEGDSVYDIPVKEGEKVVVVVLEEDGQVVAHIADYARDGYILYLCIGFAAVLVLIGRLQGIKTIATLSITIFAVFKIMLPMILSGHSPVTVAVMVAVGVTAVTILIISGFTKKSLAAAVGTSLGVIIAGGLAFLVGSGVKLTGLSSEEAVMLLYIPQGIQFQFKDLLFAGIILGALGAVMDVSVSIASAIEEIYKANRSLSQKELFLSGMNIGKDMMGTMSNTLILAYTGSSIPLLLLFMAYETSIIKIVNLDIIATEIVRSLSGSIGLILTIPITAAVSAFLAKRGHGEG